MLFTVEGWMDLEEQYVPGVVTAEHESAKWHALQAVAVAARTYVLRAMRDDPKLGTEAKPIPNSGDFQTFVKTPVGHAREAAQSTKRLVCRHGGQLILCNYVAGALWTAYGIQGQDPTETEKWVTYNEGKTGAKVKPSPISLVTRSDNRGCMSKNGAHWLASEAGYDFAAVLRYFYGADLEIAPFNVSAPAPRAPSKPPPTGPSSPTPPTGPSSPPPVEPASQWSAEAPASSSSLPLPAIVGIAFALLRASGE